jgi:hypothetical protein
MSLSDLASLGSFVSGVAVLASLVFLFFQMRQMTEQVRQAEKNQQAAIRQGRAAILIDMNLRTAEGLSDVVVPIGNGGVPASVTQLRQYLATAQAAFLLYEEEFDQHEMGLMSDSTFASFVRNMTGLMRMPGMRVVWRTVIRERYGDKFAQFIDKIIAETRPIGLIDHGSLERWSAEIAAELAQSSPA